MENQLTDTLRVQVVKNLDVYPKFKSLYLGNESSFKLMILEGSGFFTVSHDNQDIVDIVHKEREIWVTPRASSGLIEIVVEDIEVPDSVPVTAQVLISDIDRLSLWSPRSLMEQDDEMTLIVSAFDTFGNEFDDDQYQNMQFSIETEMTGVIEREFGLRTESTDLNTHFNAFSVQPGIY